MDIHWDNCNPNSYSFGIDNQKQNRTRIRQAFRPNSKKEKSRQKIKGSKPAGVARLTTGNTYCRAGGHPRPLGGEYSPRQPRGNINLKLPKRPAKARRGDSPPAPLNVASVFPKSYREAAFLITGARVTHSRKSAFSCSCKTSAAEKIKSTSPPVEMHEEGKPGFSSGHIMQLS